MAQHNRGWREREHISHQPWGGQRGRGPFSGIGPTGYRRADERIYEDACERLKWHGQIDARKIHVAVQNGAVTLTGTVRDRRTRRMAEEVLDSIAGVQDIYNNLRIEAQDRQRESGRPGGGQGRVDRVGPMPGRNAAVQGMASWGQGERGAAGYEDSGSSERHIPEEEQQTGEQ